MAGTPFDSIVRVETPEGIELELRTAGPLPRVLAWLIDASIRVAIYLVLATALGVLGKVGLGLLLVAVFALEWFYPVFFEVYFSGATPGKRALAVQVLHDDGTPIGFSASVVRNLLRFVDFLPFLYGFGFVTMIVDPRFRRLGDLAAGTLVVYTPAGEPRAGRQSTESLPPPGTLTRAEQRAVMEFAERAPKLAPERATERARFAGPLVERSPDPVSRLYAIANFLAGSA